MKSGNIFLLGLVLVTIGMIIIFFGLLSGVSSKEGGGQSELKGGGVLMIGPIPIIFGSDSQSAQTAILLAIILIIVSLIFYRRLG